MLDNHPTSRDFKDIYYVTINIRLTATFTLRGKSLNWTKKKQFYINTASGKSA